MDNKEIDILIDTSICAINMFILIIVFGFAYRTSGKMNK